MRNTERLLSAAQTMFCYARKSLFDHMPDVYMKEFSYPVTYANQVFGHFPKLDLG